MPEILFIGRKYVAYVRRGSSVRVFDRDTPVAELVPIRQGPGDAAGTALPMEQLARDGVVELATASLPDDLLTRALPKALRCCGGPPP